MYESPTVPAQPVSTTKLSDDPFQVVEDPEWGFRRLDPIPNEEYLSSFYESGYYNLMHGGKRAPDLARLGEQTVEAQKERNWLAETVHQDFISWAETYRPDPGSMLEIGCGRGELLQSFNQAGWRTTGIEPAAEVAASCNQDGLNVLPMTVTQYLERRSEDGERPDLVILRLVLEHLRDPISMLRAASELLEEGGLLIVEVPNDFNDLQLAAVESLDVEPWWVAVPDHISYFSFDSLESVLHRLGFETLDRSTSFPMELFLLMGDNYLGNQQVGQQCHDRRRRLEHTLPPEVRRKLYGAMASVGLGRTCRVLARLA